MRVGEAPMNRFNGCVLVAVAAVAASCASIFGIEEGRPYPNAGGSAGSSTATGGLGGEAGSGAAISLGGHGGAGGDGCADPHFEEVEELAELNTEHDENGPSLSPDGLTIYFGSNRRLDGALPRDLWRASRTDRSSSFGAAELVPGFELAEDDNDPAISDNGTVLYFASYRSDTVGNIWRAQQDGPTLPFDGFTPLGADVRTDSHESDPALSANELTLYFASRRPLPEGSGSSDANLWEAKRASIEHFFGPTGVTALEAVNTAAHEHDPCVSPDGHTLYFTSDRGGSDTDLYRAIRPSVDDAFGAPEPVQELNSNADDGDLTMAADGELVVFASNRAGGTGGIDLWTARRVCR